MPFIQCTKNLLDELHVSKEETPIILETPSPLGNWHANLLRIERRKCALFTHDTTLFSFFIPKLIKADFQNLTSVFLKCLCEYLTYEGFKTYLPEIVTEYQNNLHFTRSSNRTILGSMNDMAFIIRVLIEKMGGLENINHFDISQTLNKTPFKSIQYRYAIECFQNHFSHIFVK